VKVKLYSIAISHPSRAAGLMLRHKGIEHEIVDIPAGAQRVLLRVNGFRRGTVPALKINGRRVQGSRAISRALDELQPEPPLFPPDAAKRAAVEQAERWGDADLQPVPRHVFRWCVAHDLDLRLALVKALKMPIAPLTARVMKPLAWYFSRVVSGTTEESLRAELAAIPAQLDHVDELIEAGVIGGDPPNAADFQIATSVRVLLNFPQLEPLIAGRPAGELAMKIVPGFGQALPVDIPASWVPRAAPSAAGV
jgi:glutathione S-transferase